jgi:integrase
LTRLLSDRLLNPIPTQTIEAIINTTIALRNNGVKGHLDIGYRLTEIARNCDISNPEAVKSYVANARSTRTKQPVQDATKNRLLYCYDQYCKVNRIQWKKPYYKVEEKTPLIPTAQNVDLIISNASKKYAPIFTILSEIGCSPAELSNVTLHDVDTEQGIIRIRGTKGHASGTYKLKQRTAEMLRAYLHKHQEETLFPKPHAQSQIWVDTRRRAAQKLCKPELEKICLRSLWNYSGATFYKALPIRDPIAVMRHLRHKKLETTMHYIRAIVLDYEEDEQWISRTSTTLQEDAKLIEAGFQYVTERDGTKLYRKRK